VTRSLAETLDGGDPVLWARDFLRVAGFPESDANVQLVYSWEYAESGGGGGMWNPLNTTQGGYPGESDYNAVGVKNYARRADGLAANAKVIRNGYYPNVVILMEQGRNAHAIATAIESSPWGTRYLPILAMPDHPAPQPEGETMLVASPHKPTLAGRQAAASWSPHTPNVVTLTNGASIHGDRAVGGGKRQWSPPIPPGATGVGIMATIGRRGRTDGRGVVFQDDKGDTYVGLWS
jgi:hypothetical protein